MNLTRQQRSRILAGNHGPILLELKPDYEAGEQYVLSWSREARSHMGDGHVSVTPPLPLRWLTVTRVVRRAKGGWSVAFEVEDRRVHKRLLRRTPPVYDHKTMKRDQDHGVDEGQQAKARLEGEYTTDPSSAVDHLEAVDDETLKRFTKDARNRESAACDDLIAAAQDIQAIVKERMQTHPEFKRLAGLSIHRLDKEVEHLIAKTRKKAA